ncbi:hypothetical protein [Streptomyces sp. NPDC006997]
MASATVPSVRCGRTRLLTDRPAEAQSEQYGEQFAASGAQLGLGIS